MIYSRGDDILWQIWKKKREQCRVAGRRSRCVAAALISLATRAAYCKLAAHSELLAQAGPYQSAYRWKVTGISHRDLLRHLDENANWHCELQEPTAETPTTSVCMYELNAAISGGTRQYRQVQGEYASGLPQATKDR